LIFVKSVKIAIAAREYVLSLSQFFHRFVPQPRQDEGWIMNNPNIVCVGYEPHLVQTRSMILRRAGYAIHEASGLAVALSEIESDVIDGLLICNSVPRNEQEWFIERVRKVRRLLPIVCVKNHPYERCVSGCIGVDNEPESLLNVFSRTFGNCQPIAS
jgi:hypothetical protein